LGRIRGIFTAHKPLSRKMTGKALVGTSLYSIRINDQWRVCFVWRQENAYDVEIVDYH
jgi:plasmid maintenance system killer protein